VEAFHQAGILEDKLMMGAAFYGRAWRKVKSSDSNGLGQEAGTSGNKSYGYTAIKKLLDGGKYTRYWDDTAKAPYLFDGSTFISYEDTQSITIKGEYAKANGLMGVMFWEYGQDSSGELLKALYESLHNQAN
jgi:chitinase